MLKFIDMTAKILNFNSKISKCKHTLRMSTQNSRFKFVYIRESVPRMLLVRRIVNHTRKYPLVCYQTHGFNGTTAHFKGYRVTHSSRSFVTQNSVVSFRANLFWSYRHSPQYTPDYR
jgi:hypothetical protein